MHFSAKALIAAVTLCSVAGATVPAMALPIIPDNSSFQVGGSVRAMGATGYASATDTFINTTGFDFGVESGNSYTYMTPGGTVRLGGTGSQFYRDMGFTVNTAGTATDIAAGTFPAGEFTGAKAVNIASLYTFTVNGTTLSFDFNTLTSVDRSTDTTAGTQTVTASGLGIVHLTNYQDANSTFSITATRTGTGVTTTFSSSVTSTAAPVPEPMSFALLGAGLVAAGVVRRRKSARA